MMKLLFRSLFVLLILFSFGCRNHKNEKTETTKSDSLPQELVSLNKKILERPNDASLYNQRAIWYLEHNDLEKAMKDASKAVLLDEKNSEYLRTLSDVYFAGGKITKCRETLNKAITLNPNDAEAYLKLAELHFYLKEYKQTFEYTDKALQIDKLNAKADFIRGMAFKDLGDTAKAVKCFQQTVEKDQEYFHAYMQLGLIFASKHNPIAVDYYNNALNLNPKSIEALYALALFYQEHGEYNKAIEKYTMLLQLDPKYKYAHYNLGYIHLVYLQVYNQAAKHFTDAIQSDPNYAEAYYNRGYCYELLGNIAYARADYQKALQIKENYQKAIDGLNRLDKISFKN